MTALKHQWVYRYAIADVIRKSGALMSMSGGGSAGSSGGSEMAGGSSDSQKSGAEYLDKSEKEPRDLKEIAMKVSKGKSQDKGE